MVEIKKVKQNYLTIIGAFKNNTYDLNNMIYLIG
jgi:hypothetical protein